MSRNVATQATDRPLRSRKAVNVRRNLAASHPRRKARAERSNAEHAELETLAFIEWFNHHRLYRELSHISSAEHEAHYRARPRDETTAPTPHPDLPHGAGRWLRSADQIDALASAERVQQFGYDRLRQRHRSCASLCALDGHTENHGDGPTSGGPTAAT